MASNSNYFRMGQRQDNSGIDCEIAFEQLRERLVDQATYVLPVLLIPISIVNFAQAHYALGSVAAAGAALVLINLFAVRRGFERPVHNIFLVICLTAITVLSLVQRGVNGVFWVPPTLMIFSIVFPRHTIRLYIILYALIVIGTAFFTIDGDNSWRLLVSTAVTIALIYILLDVIYALQTKMARLALKDELTGAYNRREMNARFAIAADRKKRYDAASSLMIIDLDHFKSINDTYGHAAGDRVLVELVDLLRSNCRRADEVFRAGGEEFVILLPDTSIDGATTLVDKIMKALRGRRLADLSVTASIGIAEIATDETVESWMSRADGALYRAKESGRNRAELG